MLEQTFYGLCFAPDGKTLFASGGEFEVVHAWDFDEDCLLSRHRVLPVARIFDKFIRLDPEMSRGIGGTGLGLYICRELLHRMDGEIWVQSEVGKGSTFVFELPRADAA